MNERGLQEIPIFVFVGGFIGIISAVYLQLDAGVIGFAWIAGWMVGPWLLFIAVLQLHWYRKHGEWI